jgi:hypothetical protein
MMDNLRLRFVKRFKGHSRRNPYEQETETILQSSRGRLLRAVDGEYQDKELTRKTIDKIVWDDWVDVEVVDLTTGNGEE